MSVPSAFARADERMMRRGLVLAARGLGETSPNPAVGCVVVARDGRVVGEGFHARAGGPHAEVAALVEAGAQARGATLYVTLEPCAHHGRTPPCAPLVRDSGVARVVAATRDPHPLVAGRGLALLRRAGVAVETGLLAAEAARLNERFLSWARRGRPFVLLKAASTRELCITCHNMITTHEQMPVVHAGLKDQDALIKKLTLLKQLNHHFAFVPAEQVAYGKFMAALSDAYIRCVLV